MRRLSRMMVVLGTGSLVVAASGTASAAPTPFLNSLSTVSTVASTVPATAT